MIACAITCYTYQMDKKTIDFYNHEAEKIARRHESLTPHRIYDLAKKYFHSERHVLDVGCGMGRDTFWLSQNGFPAIGVDASEGMINEARKRFPDLKFIIASLPEMYVGARFDNILCSAVLMHIPSTSLEESLYSLVETLSLNGRMVLSFRSRNNDEDERLFEDYELAHVTMELEKFRGKVIFKEKDGIWKNLVFEKAI